VFRRHIQRERPRVVAAVEEVPEDEGGGFTRDSLVWSLGRLAEGAVRHCIRQPESGARYRQWLADQVRQRPESPSEQLTLMCVSLGEDGRVTLTALPEAGQFVLSIEHEQFDAVVAIAQASLLDGKHPEGVCLAHFEGDSALATRWSLGCNGWLRRCWSEGTRDSGRGAALN
jgi:hypothetical protein